MESRNAIVARFFQALDTLKAKHTIRGRQTFTTKYSINKRNLYYVEKHPESLMFDLEWMVYLVRDFGVSAEWLLLGRGEMFSCEKKEQKLANFSHPDILAL